MAITFKAALKAKLEAVRGWEASVYRSTAPAIEKLLEEWLNETTSKPWEKIATKHETRNRSREAIFQRIINMACEALERGDAPQSIGSHQRHIQELEDLAASAEMLAEHTRHNEILETIPRRSQTEPPVRVPWPDRARLYEEEANKFRLRAAELKAAFSRIGRQKRTRRGSRKDEHHSARRMFMERMSWHMRRAFGKPHHSEVATITDLACPREELRTTADEVAQAWSRRKKAKNLTTGAQ